jgi:hypothetical protein
VTTLIRIKTNGGKAMGLLQQRILPGVYQNTSLGGSANQFRKNQASQKAYLNATHGFNHAIGTEDLKQGSSAKDGHYRARRSWENSDYTRAGLPGPR